ncbi:MAG: branched-chain amino acid ABC transporter permease [Anaerolineales bacterium]|nr:branched-chain amino acid ABC transporter permease [Anaerolineales bacterium]
MTAMSENAPAPASGIRRLLARIWKPFTCIPMLSWLLGGLVAVIIEQLIGLPLARSLGMYKVPALFGILFILDSPLLIPGALVFNLLIYILPIGIVARLTASLGNKLAAKLLTFPHWIPVLIHLGLLYAILHIWAEVSDYRLLVIRLILIAIMVTLSLNVVNGFMGEFSCSHPGFIALGAYAASVFTVVLFVDDNLFGPAIFPGNIGIFFFPIGLILGGVVAALGAVLIAVPSFRTRGDYLAIVSLAFLFIIKSLFENLEFAGGPRGMGSQPDWANLPTVFVWTVLCVWIINNFVRSTLGKALNAVRDDEIAAGAMTVNTRRTKMIAFLFAAFWAGIAGGLFAHVIRYVNPGTFGLTMLAEDLAMVYFGGLNSVIGSIVGALSINLLSEALRPLEIYKWIVIPLMLILVMIYRPTGLLAFREFDFVKMIQPKQKPEE